MSTVEEVFNKHPELEIGLIFPWINLTLLWTIPAMLLAWFVLRKNLGKQGIAKKSGIAAAVITVMSFTPLGWIFPAGAAGLGTLIHEMWKFLPAS